MQAEGEQSYGEGVEVSPLKGPVEKGDENSVWTRLAEERNQTIALTDILFNMMYFEFGVLKHLRM